MYTIWSIYTRQYALGVVVSEGMSEVHTRTLVDQTHIQDTKMTIHLNQPSTGTKLIKRKLSTMRTIKGKIKDVSIIKRHISWRTNVYTIR